MAECGAKTRRGGEAEARGSVTGDLWGAADGGWTCLVGCGMEEAVLARVAS